MAKDNWLRRRLEFQLNRPDKLEDKDRYEFGGVWLNNHRLVITNATSMNSNDPKDVPKVSLILISKEGIEVSLIPISKEGIEVSLIPISKEGITV